MYAIRYPYNFNSKVLLKQLVDFTYADDDPDPTCLLAKYWELIKYDVQEAVGAVT
jgi:hypothetical protein